MQVAQKLYEGIDIGGETVGLITYMRTDGVQMAPEAIDAARSAIADQFGARYVPEKPRFYSTKAKNAQEAHEAIRPTDFTRTPDQVQQYLDADQLRLYDLIWKRGIASQMASAEIERTTVEIIADEGRADGRPARHRLGHPLRRLHCRLYRPEGRRRAERRRRRRWPPAGDQRAREASPSRRSMPTQHFTEPPPRYSEATLIKKMEELGIGRPSTYAATLATLRDREYVTHRQAQADPASQGPAGHGLPGKLLRALCRI